MPHTLKLDLYTFSLKRRNIQDADNVTFEEFFRRSFQEEDEQAVKNDLYNRFAADYVNFFGARFALNNDGTKGFYTRQVHGSHQRNYLDGIIKGGLTGIEQEIYLQENPEVTDDIISENQLTTLPYYYKIWTPFDGTVGVFMIQGYTEASLTTMVLSHLRSFFASKDYTLFNYRHIPENYKQNFKNQSIVTAITYQRQGLGGDARNNLNPIFVDQEGIKVEVKISNLNLSPDRFQRIFQRPIQANLNDLGLSEEDEYETIATYRDRDGHRSSAKVSNNLDILPTFFLPNELKEEGSEFPSMNTIRNHTNDILETVKREIGYTPEDVE
ncbi:hypothetical protein [Ekhidna sp.]|uniref:hypothetical protein n=1 Tax=Ekhidna sp. TaxID=2608089 RepID=UPI003298D022